MPRRRQRHGQNDRNPNQHEASVAGKKACLSVGFWQFNNLVTAKTDLASAAGKAALATFVAYLRSHYAQSQAENFCAEPHAIMHALASGVKPEDLLFDYIRVSSNKQNRPPCRAHCSKYVEFNPALQKWKVNWTAISQRVEEEERERADEQARRARERAEARRLAEEERLAANAQADREALADDPDDAGGWQVVRR